MVEVWRDIKNYEKLYQISNIGNIKRIEKHSDHGQEKMMKQTTGRKGYKMISLSKEKKQKTFCVHRLVAEAFIPNPKNLPQVNHKDGNKANNSVYNLEWCNNSYNQLHANRMGLCKNRVNRVIEASSKPVLVYDLDGNLLFSCSSAREASKLTGVGFKTISYHCIKQVKKPHSIKYIFRFKKEN